MAAKQKSRAVSYEFADTVRAKWEDVIHAALSDGKNSYILSGQIENMNSISVGNTYMCKNMVLKGTKAFKNCNTVMYRSYNLEVPKTIEAQALSLLNPPSTLVKTPEDLRSGGFLTLQGKILSISTPQKILVKGTPLPITNMQLSQGGQEVPIALWREAALKCLKVGEWVEVSHLRPSNHADFGFKLNSTVHTEISHSAPSSRRTLCTVVGVLEEEEYFLLLLDSGSELKVPKAGWEGTLDEFLERLPLSVTLLNNGDVVTSPKDLFEDEFSDLENEL